MTKRIKFFCNGIQNSALPGWRRQLPDADARWGDCEFIFDVDCRDYDWLIVYERLPRVDGERFSMWRETLACPPEQTLFVTAEPSSIKFYEPAFLRQFGHVLTGHEAWSIDQPGVIRSQPALKWFYGEGGDQPRTLDSMLAETAPLKTRDIATVCSSKQQRHTLHKRRYDFTQRLRQALPDLDVFGHGVRPIADKADAVAPYRYHIAIENHRCDHHWTEKISDAFLGWSLPFYYGCTNLADYFPKDSFVPIDIDDFDGTVARIREVIANDEYEKRIDAIRQARNLVLTRYNLFAVIDDIVSGRSAPTPNRPRSNLMLSRHALRASSVGSQLDFLVQRIRHKFRASSKRSG